MAKQAKAGKRRAARPIKDLPPSARQAGTVKGGDEVLEGYQLQDSPSLRRKASGDVVLKARRTIQNN